MRIEGAGDFLQHLDALSAGSRRPPPCQPMRQVGADLHVFAGHAAPGRGVENGQRQLDVQRRRPCGIGKRPQRLQRQEWVAEGPSGTSRRAAISPPTAKRSSPAIARDEPAATSASTVKPLLRRKPPRAWRRSLASKGCFKQILFGEIGDPAPACSGRAPRQARRAESSRRIQARSGRSRRAPSRAGPCWRAPSGGRRARLCSRVSGSDARSAALRPAAHFGDAQVGHQRVVEFLGIGGERCRRHAKRFARIGKESRPHRRRHSMPHCGSGCGIGRRSGPRCAMSRQSDRSRRRRGINSHWPGESSRGLETFLEGRVRKSPWRRWHN